jgi:hypothetical protein
VIYVTNDLKFDRMPGLTPLADIQPRTDDVRRAIGTIGKGVRHVAGP